MTNYGYTAGGLAANISAVTEQYNDVANTWTAKANLNTARARLAGYSLNSYGYTAGGYVGNMSAVTEQYNDVANTWTAKANLNTPRSELTGFDISATTTTTRDLPVIRLGKRTGLGKSTSKLSRWRR